MNAFPRMDATPPDDSREPDPALTARADRARLILIAVMAAMIALPVLLFVLFHT